MVEQKMVEVWIAARKSRFQIENKLTTYGVPPDEAAALIDSAEAAFKSKQRRHLVIARIVGLVMLVFGGGMTVWGFFFVDGWRIVSPVHFAIGLAGLMVTIEPAAWLQFKRLFGL
jgi:hypothetical protein